MSCVFIEKLSYVNNFHQKYNTILSSQIYVDELFVILKNGLLKVITDKNCLKYNIISSITLSFYSSFYASHKIY